MEEEKLFELEVTNDTITTEDKMVQAVNDITHFVSERMKGAKGSEILEAMAKASVVFMTCMVTSSNFDTKMQNEFLLYQRGEYIKYLDRLLHLCYK